MNNCTKGWETRCKQAKGNECECACGSANHGLKKYDGVLPVSAGEKISKSVFFASETRARSPELDFGVWWRDGVNYPTYRVSWIENTGEIYAIRNDEKEVEILGVRKTRADAEGALNGWADVCGSINSLSWARSVLR